MNVVAWPIGTERPGIAQSPKLDECSMNGESVRFGIPGSNNVRPKAGSSTKIDVESPLTLDLYLSIDPAMWLLERKTNAQLAFDHCPDFFST
jgi:hypothetical protein